jgi:hypothetical protein
MSKKVTFEEIFNSKRELFITQLIVNKIWGNNYANNSENEYKTNLSAFLPNIHIFNTSIF